MRSSPLHPPGHVKHGSLTAPSHSPARLTRPRRNILTLPRASGYN
nr:MAG TPA: hypothetical protein [Caudoviricetes sp.]